MSDTDTLPVTVSDDGFSPRSFWALQGQQITFSTSSPSGYAISFKVGVFTNADGSSNFESISVSSGRDASVWVNVKNVDPSHHTLTSTPTSGALATQTGQLNVGSGPDPIGG